MIKTDISAQIVADSINQQGDRLTSLLVTFPRIILAEVNTHRMLSKNTSSSRAIPFNKMVEAVQNDPFIPIAWQKHHSGMQGSEYWKDDEWVVDIPGVSKYNPVNCAKGDWLKARDEAVKQAERLSKKDITKQLCNRLLEPFMWTTMLITGSKEGWDNFFSLRCPQYPMSFINDFGGEEVIYYKSKKEWLEHCGYPKSTFKVIEDNHINVLEMTDFNWLQINEGQAEIHIMDLAEKIYDAINESNPKELKSGEWHIPFGENINNDGGKFVKFMMDYTKNRQLHTYPDGTGEVDMTKVKVSTAMAARTSYTVVGDENYTVVESEGFGVMESPIKEVFRRSFQSKLEAETFLDSYRKDKNLSWANWETPFTYIIIEDEREIDYEKMIKLHDRLIAQNPPHSSPMEHCARAMTHDEYYSFQKGFINMDELEVVVEDSPANGWCNNFKGFIQYRYLLEN